MDYVEFTIHDDHGGESFIDVTVADSGDVVMQAFDPVHGGIVTFNLRPSSGGGRYPDLCGAIATEVRKLEKEANDALR